MQEGTQAGYARLKDYLCDMIAEEQLKLGYERETLRFYSPCSSIGHVLNLSDRSGKNVCQKLEAFGGFVRETLGEVQISRCSDERVCFLIPAQGAEYVHENGREYPFLEELIACFEQHDITLSAVRQVFERWSGDVRCIHIGNEEFDDVLYFERGKPDPYLYCVKFDEGHAFYHRFLKADFEELFGSLQNLRECEKRDG